MNTEDVPISRLLPAEYNPRTISKQEFAALKNSVKEFGFVQPVVANKTSGNIVGGHMRVLAAKELGMATVPVHWVELDEAKEKALNLALNKISGEWDDQKLSELLYGMHNTPEINLTGFSEEEILKLLNDVSFQNKELDPESLLSENVNTCPKCNFQWEK